MQPDARVRTTPSSILRDAASCAILAPSTHNSQPWRLRLRRDDVLEIASDETRRLDVIDPMRRQMVTSCGCALYNARIAIHAAGFCGEVATFPDPRRPEVVAAVRIGLARGATDEDRALFTAIPRRRTNRRPFLDRPISAAISEQLARAARAARTTMFRLAPDQKERLGALVADADRQQFADPAFRAELRRWLAPPRSRRRDGIPFAEKEYGSSMPFAVARRLRSSHLGEEFGDLERARLRDAPLVIALATEADEPIDWLDCGQALQAVLLHATTLGLSGSFLNQVLEVPDLAMSIDKLLDTDHNVQMLLRIGWAEPTRTTARRRPLEEVLTVD